MKRINNKAFTLIELLVVIAIIGILVTIVIVAIDPLKQIQNAQDSKRRADLNQVKAAMQLYYNDKKDYPATATFQATFGVGFCDPQATPCAAGSTIYMRQVPNDTNGAYTYTRVDASNYRITADLNNPNNPDDSNTVSKCGASGDFAVCND